MPLPESWKGYFYSSETCGDYIVDLEPQGFIDLLLERASDQCPPFLAAGAIFDLILNANSENDFASRAEQLKIAAAKQWPEFDWEVPAKTVRIVPDGRAQNVPERNIINVSYAILMNAFGYPMLLAFGPKTQD